MARLRGKGSNEDGSGRKERSQLRSREAKGKARGNQLERGSNKVKLPVRKLVVEGGRSGYRCTRGDCRMVFYTRKTFLLHISKHEKEDTKDGTHSEEEEKEEVEVPRKKTKRAKEAKRVEKMKVVPKDRMSVTSRGKRTSFPCNKAGCGRLFDTKKSLNLHKRDHEQQEREEVSQDEEDPENLGENGKVDIPWASTLHCGVCESKPQFSSMADLESHRELTHPNYFNSKQCPRCPKSFRTFFHMNIHLRIHTREKPFGCPSCDKCFARKTGAREHHNFVHTTVRRYPCSKCNKSFKTKRDLTYHTKYVHDKETNSKYICSEPNCTAKFTKNNHLLSHIETHKKPLERQWYECVPCQKMFMSRISLMRHVRVHHNPNKGDKQCLYCKIIFPSEALLLKHIKEKRHDIEKPFNCAYCQFQFATRHNLRCHLKTTKHLNTVETFEEVKNYPGCSQALAQEKVALAPILACKSCESTYSSEELLTRHVELVHEGKGRLTCAKCRVEFKTRRYLTRHLSLGRCERAVKSAAKQNKKKTPSRPKQDVKASQNTRTSQRLKTRKMNNL